MGDNYINSRIKQLLQEQINYGAGKTRKPKKRYAGSMDEIEGGYVKPMTKQQYYKRYWYEIQDNSDLNDNEVRNILDNNFKKVLARRRGEKVSRARKPRARKPRARKLPPKLTYEQHFEQFRKKYLTEGMTEKELTHRVNRSWDRALLKRQKPLPIPPGRKKPLPKIPKKKNLYLEFVHEYRSYNPELTQKEAMTQIKQLGAWNKAKSQLEMSRVLIHNKPSSIKI